MPLLTTQSAKGYGFGKYAASAAAEIAWDSIATVTLSSSSSNINFTSIPSTYKHLVVRGVTRSTYGGTGGQSYAFLRINNDTGANYRQHFLKGNGATPTAGDVGGANRNDFAWESPWNSMTLHGPVTFEIADYQNTNKNKNVRIFNGADWNGASANQNIFFQQGVWKSTSAITSLNFVQSLAAGSDGDFAAGTTLALYGIKG